MLQIRGRGMWKGDSGKEERRDQKCLLKRAGPHMELKQEIPAFGGRGDFGTAKES